MASQPRFFENNWPHKSKKWHIVFKGDEISRMYITDTLKDQEDLPSVYCSAALWEELRRISGLVISASILLKNPTVIHGLSYRRVIFIVPP